MSKTVYLVLYQEYDYDPTHSNEWVVGWDTAQTYDFDTLLMVSDRVLPESVEKSEECRRLFEWKEKLSLAI